MKLPYSYKRSGPSFRALLAVSFLGHAVVFTSGGFLKDIAPRFSVEKAPTSVEVILLKEKPRPKEKMPELRLLAAKDPAAESVPQKSKKEPEKTSQKNLIPPEQKGAIEEAKPAEFKNPPPIYPLHARELGWEGLVVLNVLVGKDGRPNEIQVLKSSRYKILDEAALKAVWKWQFQPARAGGFSFASRVKIPVRFRLV